MCYDIQSSLSAWLISNCSAIYLYKRNRNFDRWNSFFIISFSTIQLLEAGLWWTQSQGLPSYANEILTKSILIVLLSQPFVQSYFGAKETRSELLKYMAFIYAAMILWGFYRLIKSPKGSFYTAPNSKGHLVWHDKSKESFLGGNTGYVVPLLYLGGLFIPLLFQSDRRGLPLLIVGGASFFFSMFIGDKESFSSLWCFYAVAYSIAAIKIS